MLPAKGSNGCSGRWFGGCLESIMPAAFEDVGVVRDRAGTHTRSCRGRCRGVVGGPRRARHPLPLYHHWRVHERHWTTTGNPNTDLTFTNPTGNRLPTQPPPVHPTIEHWTRHRLTRMTGVKIPRPLCRDISATNSFRFGCARPIPEIRRT